MSVPTDWKEVRVNDAFVFWIPPDLMPVDVRGPDSLVQRWESADMIVHLDYGRYSDPLTFYSRKKSYESVTKQISGYDGTLISFEREDGWRATAVHFPDVGRDSFGQVLKLTLFVETAPTVSREVPLMLVESVRF